MSPDSLLHRFRTEFGAADEITYLGRDFTAHATNATDQRQRENCWPQLRIRQADHTMQDFTGSDFLTPMTFRGFCMSLILLSAKIVRTTLGKFLGHRCCQGRLVTLDGQEEITPLLDDLLGNVFLAAGCINGHQSPRNIEDFQQSWDGFDLV